MIIEVVGLPGVGKTFICQKASERSDFDLVTEVIDGNWRWLALCCAVERPILSIKILYWTILYHRGTVKLLRHKLLFVLVRALAKEKVSEPGLIIDDGILQYILAISDVPLSSKKIRSMLESFNPADRKVIIIETEEEIRQKNITNRQRYPRTNFSKEYLSRFNKALSINNNKLRKILVNDFDAMVLKITL